MDFQMTSNKPYLVKAFYEWISDNQLTPYILVDVNVPGVAVPQAFVNDGKIVLNIALSAVGSFSMGELAIEFTARFAGKIEHLYVPYGAIAAIYAKENGAGTSLPIEYPEEDTEASSDDKLPGTSEENPPVNKGKKPTLTVVK
jgi:stringent starvation protein B